MIGERPDASRERPIGIEDEQDLHIPHPPGLPINMEAREAARERLIACLLTVENAQVAGYKAHEQTVARYDCRPSELWLDNGGSLTWDSGHAEWRTAEAMGPRQATAVHRAGITTMRHLMEAQGEEAWLFRRTGSVDYEGDIYVKAHHQNFEVAREATLDDAFKSVMGAVIASQVWGWAGMMTGAGYRLSQRAANAAGAIDTHGFRSGRSLAIVYRIKDDIVSGMKYARYENRSADSLRSEWGTYMQLADTSLALRALEQSIFTPQELDYLSLRDSAVAFRRFGLDTSLQATARTNNYKTITALGLREVLDAAYARLQERHDIPQSEAVAIPEIRQANADLYVGRENQDYSRLSDRVEWVARWAHIQAEAGHRALGAPGIQACLMWDCVIPEGPGQKYWRENGKLVLPPEETDVYVRDAPANTRARIRSELIRDSNFQVHHMEWNKVWGSRNGRLLTCIMPILPERAQFRPFKR